MDVTARATRSGDWWAVEVPEIPGLFTQAKRLDQIEEMVTDAATMLGHDDVRVVVEAALDAEDLRVLDEAKERSEQLAKAADEAAVASRRAVSKLRRQGLPVRDVAELMAISPQRVSQLHKISTKYAKAGEAMSRIAETGKAMAEMQKRGARIRKVYIKTQLKKDGAPTRQDV